MLVTQYKLKLYMITSTGQYYIDHKHNMVIQYIITKELYKILSGEKESYIGGHIIVIVNLIKVHIFFIYLFVLSDSSNQQIFLFFQYNDHILINNGTLLPDL